MTLTDYDLPIDHLLLKDDPELYAIHEIDYGNPLVYDFCSVVGSNLWTRIRYTWDHTVKGFNMLASLLTYCILCCPTLVQMLFEEWLLIIIFNSVLFALYFAAQFHSGVGGVAVLLLLICVAVFARMAWVADHPLLRKTKAQIREDNRIMKMKSRTLVVIPIAPANNETKSSSFSRWFTEKSQQRSTTLPEDDHSKFTAPSENTTSFLRRWIRNYRSSNRNTPAATQVVDRTEELLPASSDFSASRRPFGSRWFLSTREGKDRLDSSSRGVVVATESENNRPSSSVPPLSIPVQPMF